MGAPTTKVLPCLLDCTPDCTAMGGAAALALAAAVPLATQGSLPWLPSNIRFALQLL